MKLRCLLLAIGAIVIGCDGGVSNDLRRFDGAEVHVTVSGARAECRVSLREEKAGHSVSCASLEAYFRNDLQLPWGAKYYIVDSGNSHKEEIGALVSRMRAAGYPPIGVMAVFISEPAPIGEH